MTVSARLHGQIRCIPVKDRQRRQVMTGKRKTAMTLRRREALALLAAGVFTRSTQARAQTAAAPRIASIDWAMLETSVALGVMPVAASELIQFRRLAIEPAIPDDVLDLGLRGAPNFELLSLIRPELILISPFYTRYESRLQAIAPLVSLPFYIPGEPPFGKALDALTALGDRLGREAEALTVLAQTTDRLAEMKQAVVPYAARPTYIVNIGDARHFRAFGADSMFGDVLARLGLPNAWRDVSRFTFAAPVPLENLAAQPEARIVIVSDIPIEAKSAFYNSALWNSLQPVRQGRVIMLGNVNPYGGVTAGMRFARLLTDGLLAKGPAL